MSYGKFPKRNSELSLFIKCIELNSINGLCYSNSKSVSTYTFGIPTNNYVYSVHGGIYQRDAVI